MEESQFQPFDLGPLDGRETQLFQRRMFLDWRSDLFRDHIERMRETRKLILCNGCFDLLHAGHISMLQFAAFESDEAQYNWRNRYVVAAANSDASVTKLKGSVVNPLIERLYALSAINGVGCAVGFDEETPAELAEFLKPDLIIKGPDYWGSHPVGYEHARGVLIAPRVFEVSTTATARRLESKKRN